MHVGISADVNPTPLKPPKALPLQLPARRLVPLLQRANTGARPSHTRHVRTVTQGIPLQSLNIQVNWTLKTAILPRNHAVLDPRQPDPTQDLPSGPLSGYDYLRRKDGLRTER